MAGRTFANSAELDAFVAEFAAQQNQQPVPEFHGLSPDQMYQLLYALYDNPALVDFANPLPRQPEAPVVFLFECLADAIGERGLKPTATGNLPRQLCRETAQALWGKATYRERTEFGGINSEPEFPELHKTRILAEIAGLLRKYKGRFILSRDARRLLGEAGMAAIYPHLLRAYCLRFNWAYEDGYPELPAIRNAFGFTLYLLHRYGDTERPHIFYEDAFLRAFPAALDEIENTPFGTAEAQLRRCYRLRTLQRGAAFLGLANVQALERDLLEPNLQISKCGLLDAAVRFHC